MTPRSDLLEPAGTTGPRSSDASGRTTVQRRFARYIRVVPVMFVLLLVTLTGLAISPGLRHQLAQSFTRQDKGYLELFFVNEQAARDCPVDGVGAADTVGGERRVQVEVGVTSHFDSPRSLAWTVSVNPTRGTVRAEQGRLELRSGGTGRFTARVPVALTAGSTGYTVEVTIRGQEQRLLLHC